jgi:hypothetical protein
MGLDMYLKKHTYVKNWEHMRPEEKTQVVITKDGKPHPGIKPERVSYIIEEVMYWRKANQIHNWFVVNIQDGDDNCKEYYVDADMLQELVNKCKEAISVINNSHIRFKQVESGWDRNGKTYTQIPTYDCADKLNNILAPTPGFFFGSTEIDEWYKKDIENTISALEPLIEEGGEYYYQASW